MQSLPTHSSLTPWLVRLLTLLLAALVGASALYWALKWPTGTSQIHSGVLKTESPAFDNSRIAQLLGAQPTTSGDSASAQASAQTTYTLLGVISEGRAQTSGTRGSALIAIGDTPAKPYRVGDSVDTDLVLQSVQSRSANLGPTLHAPTSVTLELPPLPSAD